MTDEVISKSALFFFLLTLDDKLAQQATQKSLEEFSLRSKAPFSGASFEENPELEIALQCCLRQWQLVRSQFRKEQSQILMSSWLRWPEHVDLNPWKEFQKKCPENEFLAVTCVHVLGYSEATLARCLGVSEGTVRYRVGIGLTLLGQLNRPTMSSIPYS
jgi:DNA-directed RNA polymerase specialized sigma24 family protein